MYGHDQINRDYVKVHAMIGTKTNVITSVAITDRDANDGPQFPALLEKTAEQFSVREVCADKAYGTKRNLETVVSIGAEPYIPFKATAKP